MKINKSKRRLAQLLIEVGVTKFPDGANWAAQDKSGKEIYCYKNKPRRPLSWESWHHDGGVVSNGEFQANALIANWHQTVLSRAEFDQIVAETAPDADGWIEWSGGERPVDVDALVRCKLRSGKVSITAYHAGILSWRNNGNAADVIAYRLHKQQSKPEFCESVMRSIPDPDEQVWTNPPSIEQLAADYRDAKDYADRKQQEADEAKADADAKLAELIASGKELGLVIDVRH